MSDLSLSVRTSDAGKKPSGKRSYTSSSVLYPPGHRPPLAPSRLHRPLPPVEPLNHYKSTTGRAAMWAEAMQHSHAPPPPQPVGGGQTPGQPPASVVDAAAAPAKPVVDVAAARARVRKAASQIVQSKVLTALMVFLITVLLLVCINPPMAQEAVSDEDKAAGVKAKRSVKKILVWSLLVFTFALILPVAASYLPRPAASASPEV